MPYYLSLCYSSKGETEVFLNKRSEIHFLVITMNHFEVLLAIFSQFKNIKILEGFACKLFKA